MNLYNDTCQLSIIDAGGLEVLINLLESDNTKGMVCACVSACGNFIVIVVFIYCNIITKEHL